MGPFLFICWVFYGLIAVATETTKDDPSEEIRKFIQRMK